MADETLGLEEDIKSFPGLHQQNSWHCILTKDSAEWEELLKTYCLQSSEETNSAESKKGYNGVIIMCV